MGGEAGPALPAEPDGRPSQGGQRGRSWGWVNGPSRSKERDGGKAASRSVVFAPLVEAAARLKKEIWTKRVFKEIR